uniref:Uncharacterized protein n=1 Tax=Setaria digitata TaxID=48799 RepID=A0A915PKK7_9BILA
MLGVDVAVYVDVELMLSRAGLSSARDDGDAEMDSDEFARTLRSSSDVSDKGFVCSNIRR